MSASPSDHGAQCDGETVDCRGALHDLERYLDGEMPEGQLSTIRAHLAACYPCADRATFEEQLRALVRDRCAESAPSSLIEAIRARLDAG